MKVDNLSRGTPLLFPGDKVWHKTEWLGMGIVVEHDHESDANPEVVFTGRENPKAIPAALLTKVRPFFPWRWRHKDHGGETISHAAFALFAVCAFGAVLGAFFGLMEDTTKKFRIRELEKTVHALRLGDPDRAQTCQLCEGECSDS